MRKTSIDIDQLRAVAEARLANIPKDVATLSAEELLHELHVYQIELETQNEELRRAQTALEESRDRYLDLYESSPVGYFTLTDTGLIAEVNLTGAALLCEDRSRLLSRRFARFIAPEDIDQWHRRLTHTVFCSGKHSCELAIQRADGSRFYARLDCLCIMSGDNLPRVRVSISDISERKLAEDLVLDAKDQLQATLDAIPDLLFIAGENGRIVGYHSHRSDLLAAPPEKFIGKLFSDVLPPEVAEVCLSSIREASENGWSLGRTYPLTLPQGQHWFELSVATKADDKEKRFIVIARDITERKRVEELQRESSDLIYDLYHNSACGYHSLDENGIFVLINDTELSWLDYTRDEIGGNVGFFDLITPNSKKVFMKSYPTLKSRGSIYNVEIDFIRRDGTLFTGLINATAMYDSSGNYVMSRSSVVDITERKRIKNELRELQIHLQAEIENEKEKFAREIHDELGNALLAIKMDVNWLKKTMPDDSKTESVHKFLKTMDVQVNIAIEPMRRIITDLHPHMLEDAGFVATMEWLCSECHKRTGIEFKVENSIKLHQQEILNKTISITLYRILQEALTNIMRHSGASIVEVNLHQDGEGVVLSIIDNGCGLPEDQAKSSASYGIRGMRERVQQMGGEFKLDGSTTHGGLHLTVALPLPV